MIKRENNVEEIYSEENILFVFFLKIYVFSIILKERGEDKRLCEEINYDIV